MVGLEAQLSRIPGATVLQDARDGLWMVAPDIEVRAMAGIMAEIGARLSTMTAVPLGSDETSVIYHYCLEGQAVNIKTRTRQNTLPSIAAVTRQADWIEREIHDLYAVCFAEHPNPARLIRPPELEDGFFRRAATDR